MKSLVIFVLITVVTLSIIGSGVGPFFDNVEKGADKAYQSDEFQTILEQGKIIASKVISVGVPLSEEIFKEAVH